MCPFYFFHSTFKLFFGTRMHLFWILLLLFCLFECDMVLFSFPHLTLMPTQVFVFGALCFMCVWVNYSMPANGLEVSERIIDWIPLAITTIIAVSVFLHCSFHFIYAAISCLHPFFSPLFGYVQLSVSRRRNEIALIIVCMYIYALHYALCNVEC